MSELIYGLVRFGWEILKTAIFIAFMAGLAGLGVTIVISFIWDIWDHHQTKRGK
jgi:hypothetical protein